MMISDAIKNLYKKITGEDVSDKSENQIADLIQELADNWPDSGSGSIPAATTEVVGGVKMSAAVSAVSAENAGTIGAEFAQAEVQKVATLADANKVAINAIIANLKAAGIMA